ncbi:hypothetical protein NKJ71_19470 [Mesorhizobium sp. M0050]|uniref:hypothetical protein n=1 Tax=Mesorhizobium sp. M0050 TaxID=2956861 RepID=UPI00333A1B9B
MTNVAAYTKRDQLFPGYVNVTNDERGVVVTVRGDPKTIDGAYICGHAHDRGRPGRCTPGDQSCNNYCNMAPEKGPMQDAPLACKQTHCGETVSVRLSVDEWTTLLKDLSGVVVSNA